MGPLTQIKEHTPEEGYPVHIDKDGDTACKSEGIKVFLSVETDPMLYTRMRTIWSLDDVIDPLDRANKVNLQLRAVKCFVFPDSDTMVCAIEQHCTVASFTITFERSLAIPHAAVREFFKE